MTFEEYKVFADHGRETGVWDVYVLVPEKFWASLLCVEILI